ncbi:MAG: hypothetical protein KatS3mg011_0067 [Acidimicrobiia bacterium]|nr:MAG: hypothetical protein KatS3mg011_0067 [Acidimicrobiia bacterium]
MAGAITVLAVIPIRVIEKIRSGRGRRTGAVHHIPGASRLW